jgi:hypothetical protein
VEQRSNRFAGFVRGFAVRCSKRSQRTAQTNGGQVWSVPGNVFWVLLHRTNVLQGIPAGIPRNSGFRAPALPIPHIITKYRNDFYSGAYVAFVPYTGWTDPLSESYRSPALEFRHSGQEFRKSAPGEPQELPESLPEFPAKRRSL